MQQVFIKTLGCKVNTFDSNMLNQQFSARGYQVTDDASAASITVINSCSVTQNAEREARYLARRFRRENPDTLIVVTGCYAQTNSAELIKLPEIDLVIPNEQKDQIADLIIDDHQNRDKSLPRSTKMPKGVVAVENNRQGHFKSSLNSLEASSDQTRAFLKIQDGCNGFCAYCIIPYARGASRSVAPELVIAEVERLIANKTPEIVLTGIHLGDYGNDDHSSDREPFAELLRELIALPGIPRLRISSLEPAEVTPGLLSVLSDAREFFCDHFHLPLQSGCDRILKLMRRTYNTAEYAATIRALREIFPSANIGADVIPGFPGETADDFAATADYIANVGLNYLHVFPYSSRPNTAAVRMPNHLDGAIVKERAKILRDLDKTLRAAYRQQMLGSSQEVLWENDTDSDGRRVGHSRNYLAVAAPPNINLAAGQINQVLIKGLVANDRMLGLLV